MSEALKRGKGKCIYSFVGCESVMLEKDGGRGKCVCVCVGGGGVKVKLGRGIT